MTSLRYGTRRCGSALGDKQEGQHLLAMLFGAVVEAHTLDTAIDSPKGWVNRKVLDTLRFEEVAPPTRNEKLRKDRQRKAIARKASARARDDDD